MAGLRRSTLLGSAILLVTAGATAAALPSLVHPAMPAFVIDTKANGKAVPAPNLMVIYADRGSDPFRARGMAPDQHIASCQGDGARCSTYPAIDQFRLTGTRAKSVTVRLFNGEGNPIIGGLRWQSGRFPDRVRLTCDLAIADPRRACALIDAS